MHSILSSHSLSLTHADPSVSVNFASADSPATDSFIEVMASLHPLSTSSILWSNSQLQVVQPTFSDPTTPWSIIASQAPF